MELTKKRLIVYSLGLLVIVFFIYIINFYNSATDVKNVDLNGYVYDSKSKKPIENVLIIINNERYKDNKGNQNYDEYLGHDQLKIYSNKHGYYSTNIELSAYIWIDFVKEGYQKYTEKGEYSRKSMKYKTYLKSLDE